MRSQCSQLRRLLLACGSSGNGSLFGLCPAFGVHPTLTCGVLAAVDCRAQVRDVSTTAGACCAPFLPASAEAHSFHAASGVTSSPHAAPMSTAATSSSRPARVKRSLDLDTIPMLSLASPSGGACSSTSPAAATAQKAKPVDASPKHAELDWREMLARARAAATDEDLRAARGEAMLTDTFRRVHTYLRISLTERCNLRCQYCMPAEGVALTASSQLLSTPEIMRLARLFVEAGVNKVRLTGGEPTLRSDLVSLCAQLSALPGLTSLAMTSNGITLSRQLNELKAAGMNAINISLDTLRPDRFEQLARRPGLPKVLRSIDAALQLGYRPVKINCVVMRGINDDELPAFVALTRDRPVNVRFIEYMPFDGNVWSDKKMVPYKEMMARVQQALHQQQERPVPVEERQLVACSGGPPMVVEAGGAGPVVVEAAPNDLGPALGPNPHQPALLHRLDDPTGEVAKNFQATNHVGTISFITSMTSHFCGDCNRLRLLADGSFKVCLFGANEVSLRDAMRGGATDEDLRLIIHAAVRRKKAAHAGMFELAKTINRPMITIGG